MKTTGDELTEVSQNTRVLSNQDCNTVRTQDIVPEKVGIILMQDRAGNKELCWEKQSCWWRTFGRVSVWASRCLLCSGAKLASVKRRTAKSPNPEQICPANCTGLQRKSISFKLGLVVQ